MNFLLTDPLFYATAIPAVILVGLAKGGLGGAMALIGVPLMALTIPPVQAAAILLPILIVMDIVSLWTWRGERDPKMLKLMLPGAMLGIGIGWVLAAAVTAGAVRLMVGVVALAFFLRWLAQKLSPEGERVAAHNPVKATIWSTVAGFTSFVAHAGGPPYQVYALPLRQTPALYVGTSVIFFAVVNTVKLVPYFLLGQFDAANVATSAVLMPIAPLATLAGAWTVRRMKPDIFYPFMYLMVFVISLKLIWDGVAEIWF